MAPSAKIGIGIGTVPTHRVPMTSLPNALPPPRSLIFLRRFSTPRRALHVQSFGARSSTLRLRASSEAPPSASGYLRTHTTLSLSLAVYMFMYICI